MRDRIGVVHGPATCVAAIYLLNSATAAAAAAAAGEAAGEKRTDGSS